MIWNTVLFAVILVICCGRGYAQTDVDSLEQALKGTTLPLRSYSADPIVRYAWKDGQISLTSPNSHTLGIFATTSVKLNNGLVVLKGVRSTLVQDDTGKLYSTGKTPVQIQFDSAGADPSLALPKLRDTLFFPALETAIAGLPIRVARVLPYRARMKARFAADATFILKNGAWIEEPREGHTLIQPKIIKSPIGRSTGEAGRVVIVFTVTETGAVQDPWIALSANVDLDAADVDAVRDYRFTPAKFDGDAVGVELAIDLNTTQQP